MEKWELKSKDRMTEGNLLISMLSFAFPLLIGNIFQQLYNTVDAVIVGNFIGSQALAAVGSSNAVINLTIGAFLGLSAGIGILISYYYGAKEKKLLESAIHNAIAVVLVGGILLTITGVGLSKNILEFIGTPKEVMEYSDLYLRVYFLGNLPSLFYNVGSGILRATGDSQRPFYYLLLSSMVNLILDIVFVAYLNMGIMGAALATVVSQAVSAALIFLYMIKKKEDYRLQWKKIRMEKHMMRQLLTLGIPSAIQNGVISFSNLLVQGNINDFGFTAMAGCSAYAKIDGFVLLPINSLNVTITTIVGQNLGAGYQERIKKSVKICIGMTVIFIMASSSFLLLFGRKILQIFTKDPEAIDYGMRMLHILAPTYIFVALTHGYCGVIRGLKNTMVPTVVLVSTMCVLRIIWLTFMIPVFPAIETVFLSYPVTWIVSCVWVSLYYYKSKYVKRKLREKV